MSTKGLPFQGLFKRSNIYMQVITVILSISFVVISLIGLRGNSLVESVFNATSEEHFASFVVLKDREETSFEHIKGLKFSANMKGDIGTISKVAELVSEKHNTIINVTYFDDYSVVVDRLFLGEDDVFILAEAQRVIINELYPGFDDNTKVIEQISYRVKTVDEVVEKDTSKHAFTVFVTGIDTFGPISTVSRSDVNMLVTVNPVTSQILLTNIPRDTQVELASFGKLDKLTHAGVYGVNESIKTLENFLDIDIDYYLQVNFNSLKNIVDAMGGVDVDSQFEFDNGGFIVKKGMNHLDGEQALVFARARYNLPDMDNDRILNHQALMSGVIKKMTGPSIIGKTNDLLNAIQGSFELSMPDSEFRSLLKNQIDKNSKWDIVTNTIMGEEIWSETTYSMPGHNLYLVKTYPEDITRAQSYFVQIYLNEPIN